MSADAPERAAAQDGLDGRYLRALRAYLHSGEEEQLHEAYELGREALSSGMGLLAFIDLHHRATARVAPARSVGAAGTGGPGRFLVESLSPYEMVSRSNQDSNAALRRLNQVLEDEAKRIAHGLHDEAGQLLATVYLELADMAHAAPAPLARKVESIVGHLDQVREQIRRLSHELRPPILDQLGLVPAIKFLADGVRKRAGLEVVVHGATGTRFPQAVETALYRVVQEALNNAIKHGAATKVVVGIEATPSVVQCSIADDGAGFDRTRAAATGNGLGLTGIRERVGALRGEFELRSAPGAGTTLSITIPLTEGR